MVDDAIELAEAVSHGSYLSLFFYKTNNNNTKRGRPTLNSKAGPCFVVCRIFKVPVNFLRSKEMSTTVMLSSVVCCSAMKQVTGYQTFKITLIS